MSIFVCFFCRLCKLCAFVKSEIKHLLTYLLTYISAVIPSIMIIFMRFLLYQRTKSLNRIFYQVLEFNMMAKIEDGC